MGENHRDQDRDYSDLSDQNQQNLKSLGNSQTARGFYDDLTQDGLKALENSPAAQNSSKSTTNSDILPDSRSNGTTHTYTGGKKSSRQTSTQGLKRSKKALIAAATGLTLFGGFSAYMPILIGTALPIHVAEIISQTNSAAQDMNDRSNLVLSLQTKKGYKCKNAATCSFQNVSEKQLKKFRDSGWTIDDADLEDAAFGKKKLTRAISPDGEVVDSDNMAAFLRNPKNRISLKKVYNGHFYSFRDKVYKKVSSLFNLVKAPKKPKADTEAEIIDKSIEQANSTRKPRVNKSPEDKEDIAKENNKNQNNPEITADDVSDETVNTARNTNNIIDEITDAGKQSVKIGPAAFRSKVASILAKAADNPFQAPCGFLQLFRAISITAKSTKAIIIGNFAFYWLSMFNKLKAGDASPAEVSAMGNLLTGTVTPDEKSQEAENRGVEESQNSTQSSNIYKQSFANFLNSFSSTQNKPTIRKAATDSQGWQSIAYGSVIKKLDGSAGKWVSGAYMFADAVEKILGFFNNKVARVSCNVLTSNFVELSETVITFALIIGSGGAIIPILAGISSIIVNLGLPLILGPAVETFAKSLAGNVVDKFTRGEDFGNALVSGSGSFMSKNSIAGGGALLTKDQATAKYLHTQELIALEAEEKRNQLSPLDPSSRHTFIGSIIHSMIPYQNQLATIGGFLPSMLSITQKSLASIMPTASANSAAKFRKNLDTCNDELLSNIKVATDIFCNPYASIPTSSIEIPTEQVIEKLTEAGEYDPNKEGAENDPRLGIKKDSRLDYYRKICVERETPVGVPTPKVREDLLSNALHFFGLHDDDDQEFEVRACITSNDNPLVPYYSAFFTDIRIKEGLDDDSFEEKPKDEKPTEIKDIAYPTAENYRKLSLNFGHDGYSKGIFHNGIDIPMPIGEPVYAFKEGTVITAKDANIDTPQDNDNGGCGGAIYIDHGQHDGKPLISQYCHLQKGSLLVKKGDQVKAGQQIAKSGNTGMSSGPHLHFGLRRAKNPSLPNRSPNARKEDINKYYYDPTEFLKEYIKV